MEIIEIEVRCMGCNELTTPATVDWELFRIGYHVHDNPHCFLALTDILDIKSNIVVGVNDEDNR